MYIRIVVKEKGRAFYHRVNEEVVWGKDTGKALDHFGFQ